MEPREDGELRQHGTVDSDNLSSSLTIHWGKQFYKTCIHIVIVFKYCFPTSMSK